MGGQRLSDKQRKAIVTHLAAGKTLWATAKLVGCSKSTVKKVRYWLSRGLPPWRSKIQAKPKRKKTTKENAEAAKTAETETREQIEMRKRELVEGKLGVERRKREILFGGWRSKETDVWHDPRFPDEAEAGRE